MVSNPHRNIICEIKLKSTRLTGHVALQVKIEMRAQFWVGKPEATRPFGRPGRRREDNIKVGSTEFEGMDSNRMPRGKGKCSGIL